jgi:class 3 adenylate cyclase
MSELKIHHRLTAILAADAVGYSRLMAADDRATVAALDAARNVFRMQIEAHHGRVVDMAGDLVLAVFDTASGLVRAALAIQAQLESAAYVEPEARRMRFRIGAHLDDVLAKSDGTVYGDGVNIAARLQALAEPGTVMVSEAIHSAIRGKVQAKWIETGEQSIKNMPYSLRTFRSFAVGTTESMPVSEDVAPICSMSAISPSASLRPSPTSTPDTGDRLMGAWTGTVRYGWGASYEERIEFKRHAGQLTGTVSFLGFPRAIWRLQVDRLNVHFHSHSTSSIGSQFRELTHAYAAELRGHPPNETLAIRLQSSGGFSSEKPLEFEARRSQ